MPCIVGWGAGESQANAGHLQVLDFDGEVCRGTRMAGRLKILATKEGECVWLVGRIASLRI